MYSSYVSVTDFSNSLLGPAIADKTAAFSALFPYQEDLGAYFVFVKAQGHWLVHHTTASPARHLWFLHFLLSAGLQLGAIFQTKESISRDQTYMKSILSKGRMSTNTESMHKSENPPVIGTKCSYV